MDALLVEYGPDQKVRFVVKTARGVSLSSAPLQLDAARHTVKLTWGGLYPDDLRPKEFPDGEWHRMQRTVTVVLDDKKVLQGEGEFVLATPEQVVLGGASPAGPSFSGRLQSVKRLPAQPQ